MRKREQKRVGGRGGSIPHVTDVQVIGDYSLRLTFDDGLVRDLDFADDLWGEMFQPLKDPAYFAQVFVDPESRTIAWPHGLDLDPCVLHGDYEPDTAPRPR